MNVWVLMLMTCVPHHECTYVPVSTNIQNATRVEVFLSHEVCEDNNPHLTLTSSPPQTYVCEERQLAVPTKGNDP
jgi:hypothetical protein